MSAVRLRIRTPLGLLLDRRVRALRAEDVDGWFGIRPGRAALVCALVPGLLVFRVDEADRYVALAGGLLSLQHDDCRVMTSAASVFDSLDEASAGARLHEARQAARGQQQRDALFDLAREAYRRLTRLHTGH